MSVREVILPDGSVAEFPDSMGERDIQAELELYLSNIEGGTAPTSGRNPHMPEQQMPAPTQGQSFGEPPRRPAQAAPQEGDRAGLAGKYEQITQQLLDPNIDAEMRRALETQRSALGAALGVGSDMRTRGAQAMNILGAATDAVGQAGSRAVSVVSPSAGAAMDRTFRGGSEHYTGGEGTAERDAMDSAVEAARLREAQGSTDARNSMGAAITRGDPNAAAQQAAAARQQVEQGNNTPGQRPSDGKPVVTDPVNVAFPREMSITNAQQTNTPPSSVELSMGDGSAVEIRPMPRAAMQNGVRTGMDFLMEKSDEIMNGMLMNGDISGAIEFRDFVRGEQAQNGMMNMNRAVIAANYGDSETFTRSVTNMVTSFEGNTGWQVDQAGTKLLQNDQGQAIGAQLVLKNAETGETLDQEVMGMANVIGMISDFASPTAAFERQQERIAGAVGQQIAQASGYQEAYDKAMSEMFDKSSFVDLDGSAISPDEMQRRHQMVVERIRSVRPDLVPATERDTPPPSGGASGVGAQITGGSNGQPVPTFGG